MSWLDRFRKKPGGEVAQTGSPADAGECVLVPGELSVLIEDHELRVDPDERVPKPAFALPGKRCRSYLTSGLAKLGQREIMFVLALPGEQVTARYEHDVLNFLRLFHVLAGRGRTVDSGDITTFADPGPFGLPMCGLAYLGSAEGPGPAVPEGALLALLLRPEECAAAHVGGPNRAVAWIARSYRLFPYPKFSDPTRPTSVPQGLSKTLLEQLPMLSKTHDASVFLHNKTLVLRTTARVFDQLAEAIAAMQQNPVFALICGRVPSADGRVVWTPKGDAPEIIGPSGSLLSIIEGGFLIFLTMKEVNAASIVEDGFSVTLRAQEWAALRDALASKADFEIEMAGKDDRFVRQFRIENTDRAEPTGIVVKGVRLYLPEDVQRRRLGDDVSLLVDYVDALHRRVISFWHGKGQPDALGLLVGVGVRPGKRARVWCDAVEGEIAEDLLIALEQSLGELPSIEVKEGPFAFALEVALRRPVPDIFPVMPKAWVSASSVPLLVPDELFDIIWPDPTRA